MALPAADITQPRMPPVGRVVGRAGVLRVAAGAVRERRARHDRASDQQEEDGRNRYASEAHRTGSLNLRVTGGKAMAGRIACPDPRSRPRPVKLVRPALASSVSR